MPQWYYLWGSAIMGGMSIFLLAMTVIGWEGISNRPLFSGGVLVGSIALSRCLAWLLIMLLKPKE